MRPFTITLGQFMHKINRTGKYKTAYLFVTRVSLRSRTQSHKDVNWERISLKSCTIFVRQNSNEAQHNFGSFLCSEWGEKHAWKFTPHKRDSTCCNFLKYFYIILCPISIAVPTVLTSNHLNLRLFSHTWLKTFPIVVACNLYNQKVTTGPRQG